LVQLCDTKWVCFRCFLVGQSLSLRPSGFNLVQGDNLDD
jgi:hypothetical protein